MKKIIPIIDEISLHISIFPVYQDFVMLKPLMFPQIAPLVPKTSKINFTNATYKKLIRDVIYSFIYDIYINT